MVHHQPHYSAQKPNEGVLWGYCLYPRREGDFGRKPFIEMTGKEMLEETLGHLAAVDPAADNIADHTHEIMASVVPKSSRNLAFISQFAEVPFDMVFTEQYSVRCAQIAVYHFLGIPESRLTKLHHYETSPRVLAKAVVTMFR